MGRLTKRRQQVMSQARMRALLTPTIEDLPVLRQELRTMRGMAGADPSKNFDDRIYLRNRITQLVNWRNLPKDNEPVIFPVATQLTQPLPHRRGTSVSPPH